MDNCADPEQASLFRKLAAELNTSIPGETPSALAKRIKQKGVDLDRFFKNTKSMPEFKMPVPGFKQPQVRKMLDDLRGNPDYYLDQLKLVPNFLIEKAVQQNPKAFEGVGTQGITGNIGKMAGHSVMGLAGGIYKEAFPAFPALPGWLTSGLGLAANSLLNTSIGLELGKSQLGNIFNIEGTNDTFRQWGSGGNLDSFFDLAERSGIQELKNPLIQTWIRTDPKGAFDYIARAAEAKGAKLYEPPAAGGDIGTTLQYFGNQSPKLRDATGNASRFMKPFSEVGKLLQGKEKAGEWLTQDVAGMFPAAGGLARNYVNLVNESDKQHLRRLADDPQYFSDNFSTAHFGNLVDSMRISRNPILSKQKGYKSPKQILSEMFEGAKSEYKRYTRAKKEIRDKFLAGDLAGGSADIFNKGFRASGRAYNLLVENYPLTQMTVGRPFNTAKNDFTEAALDPTTQRNYALGYLGNPNRGASDTLPYAAFRKLQGLPNPAGYQTVREHLGRLKDAGKNWGANFLIDPLTGAANAWNNPYGRTAILGAGGLAALVGGKSIMDRMAADKKKLEEEEALRTGFKTKGLHRYGAY